MQTVHVLFGTESGNAEGLARRAADALKKATFSPVVIDMMDFPTDKLVELRQLLVITSTYGNGDPPSNAETLHAFLMKKSGPLPELSFSVCALGDTTYDRFAQCGKDFDKRLDELGAKRIAPRQDCDVDYDDPFDAWLAKAIDALRALALTATSDEAPVSAPTPSKPAHSESFGTRRNPIAARVTKNVNLNGVGSTKETRHVELAFDPAALKYELGDSIGVWPTNDPALVEELLRVLGIPASAEVDIGEAAMPIERALATKLDIVQPDARLVEKIYGDVSHAERKDLLVNRHVVDMLVEKRPVLGAAELAALLRPLAPRQYSIASSPSAHPGEVHLTVAVVRYELGGRARGGVASIQLADRAGVGSTLPIYAHASPKFRIAAPDEDMIMIGPGTGVAPFRAFLQERRAKGHRGRSWLFFGARNAATDFLYGDDFRAMVADGTLTKLSLAFSRDEARKVYVQHRMVEEERELFAWIERGAIIYVCGDAQHMAPDVHSALAGIVRRSRGTSEEKAREELDGWMESGRYRKDVY